MNKIDLIIDALEQYVNVVVSHNDPNNFSVRVKDGGEPARKALTAARELKATYPQGAKVRPAEFVAAATIGANVNFVGTPMIWAEWPTRSEVAMSPEHLPQYIATNNIKPTTEGGGGAGGAQPEQAPFGYFYEINGTYTDFSNELPPDDGYDKGTLVPVYTAPRKEWVGLTNEELVEIRETHQAHIFQLMFAVEAKIREKNNAI